MARYVKAGAIETTFGADNGGYNGIRATSISWATDRGVMFEENIDNYIPTTGYGGALKNSGSIETNFRPIQCSTLLEALLGTKATTTFPGGGAATKYTLGWPKSIGIKMGEETAGGSFEMTHNGCAIKSLGMEFAAKEFVKAKFDYLSKIHHSGSYSAPASYSSDEPLLFYRAEVKLNATTSFKIRSLTMDIDRKIDEDRFIVGDYTLHELGMNGMTELGGTLTFTEHEYTEYRRALFGDPVLTDLDGRNLIGGPTLVVICTNNALSPATKLYIEAGVSIYSKGDVTMTGMNQSDKKIDYKIIGNTFGMYVATT